MNRARAAIIVHWIRNNWYPEERMKHPNDCKEAIVDEFEIGYDEAVLLMILADTPFAS